jgi:histidine triad (HIT) family protein
MIDSCTFCKVVNNEAKATIVYRDEQVTAFRDIHPVGPTHILIVPNKHIQSVNEMEPEDKPLVGHMIFIAGQLAAQEHISEGGYRLIMNTGPDGGQTVFHMHLHLIGGSRMKHPMG